MPVIKIMNISGEVVAAKFAAAARNLGSRSIPVARARGAAVRLSGSAAVWFTAPSLVPTT